MPNACGCGQRPGRSRWPGTPTCGPHPSRRRTRSSTALRDWAHCSLEMLTEPQQLPVMLATSPKPAPISRSQRHAEYLSAPSAAASARHALRLNDIDWAHDEIVTGPDPAPLRKAATIYQAAIDNLTQRAGIAA
jgi:hypothetical protein